MQDLVFGAQLTVTGMAVVFTGLFLLFILMTISQRLHQWASTNSPPAVSHPVPSTLSPDTIPPEVVVAIAAAAASTLGKPVRVKRIRYRTGPAETVWSKQGRITIMGSHTTRR
jgi:Na+-transporting methylmalonyl-CoA/oxaloacetate decarboxylase gamma subunit